MSSSPSETVNRYSGTSEVWAAGDVSLTDDATTVRSAHMAPAATPPDASDNNSNIPWEVILINRQTSAGNQGDAINTLASDVAGAEAKLWCEFIAERLRGHVDMGASSWEAIKIKRLAITLISDDFPTTRA